MKFRVRTGENRCKWVWMGVDGCVRVQGVQGTQKQDNWGSFRVSQTRIWVLWPGKFPRTSCFDEFVKKWYEWVQIGTEWFRGLRMNAWARREAKTRQKEPQMGEQGMFCDVCTQWQKAECVQGWSWWSERMIRRNGGGEEEARGTIWIVISKEGAKKRTTALKKTKTSTLKLL